MQLYLYPKMKFRTVLRFFQCYLFNYFFSTKVMVLQVLQVLQVPQVPEVPEVPDVPDPRSADLRFSNTQAINSLHLLLRKNWNSLFLYAWINFKRNSPDLFQCKNLGRLSQFWVKSSRWRLYPVLLALFRGKMIV